MAQTGFEISVASDDRFRGQTVSGDRPIGTATLAYDDVRGLYAGISATVVATRDSGVRPHRSVQYVGYARRLSGALTFDIGITNRVYSRFFTGDYARRLTEAYFGLIGRRVQSHLYLTPDYDGRGGEAAYVDVNATLVEHGPWSLAGHGGVLTPPRDPGRPRFIELDWRLGVARRFDRLAITVQWAGNGPNHDSGRWQSGLILGARRSF